MGFWLHEPLNPHRARELAMMKRPKLGLRRSGKNATTG
jgi:hypothetical protein